MECEKEKLIQRKKRNGRDKLALTKCCSDLAKFFCKRKEYSNAAEEYKIEANIYDELKLRMNWGKCNGKIAEMYMLMLKFDDAILYAKKYLDVSRELKDVAEEQAALSCLGIIYLFKGQHTTNEMESKSSLWAAEKAFYDSLLLCDKLLVGKKNVWLIMDKKARLFLNIGKVQENLGNLVKALECINKAIEIGSKENIFDVLHNCYTIEALLHSSKRKDYETALSCLKKALHVAGKLKDKDQRTCETMVYQADILCTMSKYNEAKDVIKEACKLKATDSLILSNAKIVANICELEKQLESTDPSNHLALKDIYEKLGDFASQLHNFANAAKYYHKMLEHAQLAGESGKSLAPIYVSLYQSYRDMGSYDEALPYYEKEYELIKDIPVEVYNTMYFMAETLYFAKKPYEQIEKACLRAKRAAQEIETNGKRYEIKALKRLLFYQKQHFQTDKMIQTQNDLKALGYENFDDLDNSGDEQSSVRNCLATTEIDRNIHLECLTDVNEEPTSSRQEAQNNVREEQKTVKKHKKGEGEVSYDALLAEADKFCQKSDYKNAGKVLKKAYKKRKSDKKIENYLRAVAEMYNCEKILAELDTTDTATIDHEALKDHYEKLGDCASYLKNFSDAAKYYHKMLEQAQLLGESGKALIPIYVSLYQSYKDMGSYEKALPYYEKEYELVKDIPREVFNTMYYMADTLFLAEKPYEQLEKACLVARRAAQEWQNKAAEIAILRKLLHFQEQNFELEKLENTKQDLIALGYTSENSQDFDNQSSVGGFAELNFDTDINLEALTDFSDSYDDDEEEETTNKPRRPSKGSCKKTNNKGETQKTPAKTTSKNRGRIIFEDDSDVDDVNSKNNINRVPRLSNDSNSSSAEFETSDTNMSLNVKENLYGVKGKHPKTTARKRILEDQVNDSGVQDNSEINKIKKKRPTGKKSINDSQSKDANQSNNLAKLTGNGRSPMKASPRKALVKNDRNNSNDTRNENQKQVLPLTTVKIHVEDKLLLVPIKMETINTMTISWLVDEAKSRYSKLTGKNLVFNLMTSDGAILSDDDPLSLVLSSPELKTCIINQNTSSVKNDNATTTVTSENEEPANVSTSRPETNNDPTKENHDKAKIIEMFQKLIDNIPEENLNAFWSQTKFLATLNTND